MITRSLLSGIESVGSLHNTLRVYTVYRNCEGLSESKQRKVCGGETPHSLTPPGSVITVQSEGEHFRSRVLTFASHFRSQCSLCKPLPEPVLISHATSGAGAHFARHFRSRCSLCTPLPEPVLTLQAISGAGAHFARHFRSRCSFCTPLPELVLTFQATSGVGAHFVRHFRSLVLPLHATSGASDLNAVHFQSRYSPCTPVTSLPQKVLFMQSTSGNDVYHPLQFRKLCSS